MRCGCARRPARTAGWCSSLWLAQEINKGCSRPFVVDLWHSMWKAYVLHWPGQPADDDKNDGLDYNLYNGSMDDVVKFAGSQSTIHWLSAWLKNVRHSIEANNVLRWTFIGWWRWWWLCSLDNIENIWEQQTAFCFVQHFCNFFVWKCEDFECEENKSHFIHKIIQKSYVLKNK